MSCSIRRSDSPPTVPLISLKDNDFFWHRNCLYQIYYGGQSTVSVSNITKNVSSCFINAERLMVEPVAHVEIITYREAPPA